MVIISASHADDLSSSLSIGTIFSPSLLSLFLQNWVVGLSYVFVTVPTSSCSMVNDIECYLFIYLHLDIHWECKFCDGLGILTLEVATMI